MEPLRPVGVKNIGPCEAHQSGGLFDPRVQRRYLAQGKIAVARARRNFEHWERIISNKVKQDWLDWLVIAANWREFHDCVDENREMLNPRTSL